MPLVNYSAQCWLSINRASLNPCWHPIQIMWWFLRKVKIVLFVLVHTLILYTKKASIYFVTNPGYRSVFIFKLKSQFFSSFEMSKWQLSSPCRLTAANWPVFQRVSYLYNCFNLLLIFWGVTLLTCTSSKSERYPWRMLLVDPVFDETQNWNKMKCSIFLSLFDYENLHVFMYRYIFVKKNGSFTSKMRYLNMLTLPQNGGSRISKDLKFQKNLHVFMYRYIFVTKNGSFTSKMRYLNMLTLPQNGGSRISKDLKFQNFPREDAPGHPYWGGTFGTPHFIKPLS